MLRNQSAPMLLMATVLVASACNGSESANSTTAPFSMPTPTSAPPATSASPTTTPTTGSTSTTSTTSTTTTIEPSIVGVPDDLTSEEQAVIDAYEASWVAFRDALRNPTDPASRIAIQATDTGDSLIAGLEILDDFIESDYVAIPNEAQPSRYRIKSIEVDGDEATVVTCDVNSDVVIRSDDEQTINDGIAVRSGQVVLHRVNDRWKVESGVILSDVGEVTPDGGFRCGE